MTPSREVHLTPLRRPEPQEEPVYDHERGRLAPGPRFELYSLLDNLFIAAGVVVSIWLALLYLVEGFSLTPIRLLYLLGFWVLLTYITLPRLHQLMTWIYLPDYFFGRTRTTEGCSRTRSTSPSTAPSGICTWRCAGRAGCSPRSGPSPRPGR